MKKLFVSLLVLLCVAATAFAQTPFDFPANPTVDQVVTGPAGQFKWDGTKWVAVGSVGPFAPLDNPTSGQNNYSSIESPTFTGTVVAPALHVTSTATAKDAENAGSLIVSGTTTLGTTNISIANITSAIVSGVLQIPPSGQIVFNGNPVGGACPAGEFVNALSTTLVPTCAAGGGGGPFLPENNPTYTGLMTGPSLLLANTTSSSIYWGSVTQPNASMLSLGAGSVNLQAGSHFNGTWIADATWNAGLNLGNNGAGGGSMSLYFGSGNTVGDPSSSTLAATWDAAGLIANGRLNLTNTFSSSVYFGNATHPSGSILAWYGGANDDVRLSAGTHYDGATWIADAPAGQTVDLSPSGITFLYGSGYTVGGAGAYHPIGRFQHNPSGLSGLALGGYAAMINGNGGLPALSIGNGYIGGETWANLDISGASYFNGQWIADCGAGGGVSLLQMLGAGSFTMYGAGSLGCGAAVPWNREASWDLAGSHIVHMDNDQYYGVPSVSNGCQLEAGSRDTFGVIYCPASTSVSLSFSRPFRGNAVCVVSHDGPNAIGTWYVNSRNSAYALFHCYVQNGTSTPGTCPNSMRVAYHCAGIGG